MARQAVVAVLRRGGRLLAIRRGPRARRPGYWGFLAGALEPGETEEQALVREVREEVGLAVEPVRKVWESKTDDGTFALNWWTVVELREVELRLNSDEVSEVCWVTPREFLELEPTFAGDREFVRRHSPRLARSQR